MKVKYDFCPTKGRFGKSLDVICETVTEALQGDNILQNRNPQCMMGVRVTCGHVFLVISPPPFSW